MRKTWGDIWGSSWRKGRDIQKISKICKMLGVPQTHLALAARHMRWGWIGWWISKLRRVHMRAQMLPMFLFAFSVVFTTALTMWSASVGALTLRRQLLPLKVGIFALLLYVQKFLCIALSFGFPFWRALLPVHDGIISYGRESEWGRVSSFMIIIPFNLLHLGWQLREERHGSERFRISEFVIFKGGK